MNDIDEQQHVYILCGPRMDVLRELKEYLMRSWGVAMIGNTDVREFAFETMGIDDARLLQQGALTKPQSGKNIFIISSNFIGSEAQNALLKLLEEPIADTYFFFIMNETSSVFPTVLSRVRVITRYGTKPLSPLDPQKFLHGDIETRLKLLSGFLSHESESKKSDALKFLNALEIALTQVNVKDEARRSLETVLMLKKYLFDRSPSIKMIVEHLALTLPVVK